MGRHAVDLVILAVWWDRCATFPVMTDGEKQVRAVPLGGGRWQLAGGSETGLVNDYLGYLADRGYSPQTVRAYAFDLLAFVRWLAGERLALAEVSTDVVLRYLAYCRRAPLPGRP